MSARLSYENLSVNVKILTAVVTAVAVAIIVGVVGLVKLRESSMSAQLI